MSIQNKPAQRLFIPGPTDVLPEVLAAQSAPMIGHRSDEFESLFAKCESQLRTLFQAKDRVFILAASGSGLHEAAIRNAVSKRVLCFVNGAFSERWFNCAEGCDKEAIRVDIPWNTAVKPDQVAEALRKALVDGPIDAITVVHNETSTGVMSPVGEIAKIVRELSPQTLVMVDAVSSAGGIAIPFDAWDLDILMTSSQKAFALPPGLAFCAVSNRLMDKAKTVKGRGWYWDFINLEKSRVKNTTPATPAISLMRALSLQLDLMVEEGIENVYARHQRMAEKTRQWALDHDFDLMAEEGYRSVTVTTVTNNLGIDIGALNKYLARFDMEISDGYGKFKGQAFRIAHMGVCTEADLDRLFAKVEEFMLGQR